MIQTRPSKSKSIRNRNGAGKLHTCWKSTNYHQVMVNCSLIIWSTALQQNLAQFWKTLHVCNACIKTSVQLGAKGSGGTRWLDRGSSSDYPHCTAVRDIPTDCSCTTSSPIMQCYWPNTSYYPHEMCLGYIGKKTLGEGGDLLGVSFDWTGAADSLTAW